MATLHYESQWLSHLYQCCSHLSKICSVNFNNTYTVMLPQDHSTQQQKCTILCFLSFVEVWHKFIITKIEMSLHVTITVPLNYNFIFPRMVPHSISCGKFYNYLTAHIMQPATKEKPHLAALASTLYNLYALCILIIFVI